WIDYPTFDRELAIVTTKVPQAPAALSRQVTAFVQELRRADLYKVPGIAETLDWTAALVTLDRQALSEDVVRDTLGVLLQSQDAAQKASAGLGAALDRIRAAG